MCFQNIDTCAREEEKHKKMSRNLEKSEWEENGEAQIEEKEASPLVGWTPTLVIITIR